MGGHPTRMRFASPFVALPRLALTRREEYRKSPTTAERWGNPFGITPGREHCNHDETALLPLSPTPALKARLEDKTSDVESRHPRLSVWALTAVWPPDTRFGMNA